MLFPPILRTCQGLPRVVLCLVLGAVAPACRRAEITSYVAPRDPSPDSAPAPSGPDADEEPRPAAGENLPKLGWVLPDGWQDMGGDGRMNLARFQAGSASVNVTPLSGMEGQESMLVNMWRSVLGQSALSDAEAAAALVEVEIAGEKGRLFDLSAERQGEPVRIVTAFLHRDGRTWFFKLQGTPAEVEPQLDAFRAFIKSVRFEAAGSPAGNPPSAGTTPPPAPSDAVPGALPTGWKPLAAGPMQAAKFSAGDAGAEVAVSIFPDITGGITANVQRWRGQLGLPEATEAELKAAAVPLPGAPEGSVVVDLVNGERALTGAIVPRGGRFFFYKLTGNPAAVQAARAAFIAFASAQS